jgi:hypothetical protein
MEWIPVGERLPECDGRYAIIYEQGEVRRRFIGDYLCVERRWTGTLGARVTHWLELPPLPESPCNPIPLNTEARAYKVVDTAGCDCGTCKAIRKLRGEG